MYSYTFGIVDHFSDPISKMMHALKGTTAQAVHFSDHLGMISQQTKGLTGVTQAAVSGMDGLKNMFVGALAIGGVQELGNNVIETLAKFEKFEAVLTNTLGSNSAAQGILKGITDFAASTPFQVDELTDSFVKFANQGFAPSLKELRSLGDLASSTGKGFDQLAEAVIDAQVGEFERLKEFGIQAKKNDGIVSFTFKNSTVAVKENSDAIRGYLLGLGNIQGVAGAMSAISATTGGTISNIKDQMTSLYLEVGQQFKPVISETLSVFATGLKDTTTWIHVNKDAVSQWAAEFGTIAKAMGTTYVTFRALSMGVAAYQSVVFIAANATTLLAGAQATLNAVMMANPIGLVVGGLAALVGAAVYCYDTFAPFRAMIDGTWAALKVFGEMVYTWGITPLIGLGEILMGVFTGNTTLIQAGLNDSLQLLKSQSGNMLDAGMELGGAFTKGWNSGMSNFHLANPAQSVVATSDMDRYYNGAADPFTFAKKAVGGGAMSGKNQDLGIKSRMNEVKGSDKQIKNITINIQKLVEKVEYHIDNGKSIDVRQIQEVVTKALLSATNDFNYQ
jgi:hypothetical protein